MSAMPRANVLIVDDNQAIHADFVKILQPRQSTNDLEMMELLAMGESTGGGDKRSVSYDLEHAYRGAEALDYVQAAVNLGSPYALAFVDMRMPPGWDGLETIEHLWEVDPGLQVVICSAYSDYDWGDLLRRLKHSSQLLIVKKPFEAIEVLQCANAMTSKWRSERELKEHLVALETVVKQRTTSLEDANTQLRDQMRLREAAEIELGLAQKLESVGRLASGIAHEINTPMQYISDSVYFLRSAFGEVLAKLPPDVAGATAPTDSDLQFLIDEIPNAIDRTLEGAERVATIVRAMKEFAHPDGSVKALADLNRAIETTLLIARNEYKYVATVQFRGGDIPEVTCNVGELSQVFLNLIVNSAHALADAGRDAAAGRIDIQTQVDGDYVEISFADNGCGIPTAALDKIYDPFFTTKEIGRGSGQGLAIARSIVVEKHAGKILVESTVGTGTRFLLRLPIVARDTAAA